MRQIRISILSKGGYAILRDYLSSFVSLADKMQIPYEGPKIILKEVKIATRKNISGSGSKTWDRWIKKIYKAKIKLYNRGTFLKEFTQKSVNEQLEVSVKF